MAACAATLWRLAELQVLEAIAPLVRWRAVRRSAFGATLGPAVLREAYRDLPACDFSRDVLQRAVERLLVLPMAELEWSDWGRPERVEETLERLGKPGPFAAARAPLRRRPRPAGPPPPRY